MRYVTILLMLVVVSLEAAEREFDFSLTPQDQVPTGFRSAVTGEGKPGDWKVIWDEVPPLLPPLSSETPVVTSKPVLAQLAQDPADEHFPLLIFEQETYGDFRFSTRFKTVRGTAEQMAGIAFRIQDETNYYVLRASSLGDTFRFYKVVNGERGAIIGPSLKIPSGVWHEIAVECKGNQILCFLNGKQEIPVITDNTFASGKIGFWTKSDSVSYFADAKISYTPREVPAQTLVQDTISKYSRLLGLKIFTPGKEPGTTRLTGSTEVAELGSPGGAPEWDVIERGVNYYGKGKKSVLVTMPLRDRNGEVIAAVKVIMKTFPGQTEKNALERAAPIVKDIQARVRSLEDLTLN